MSGLGLTFLRRGNLAHPTAGSDYILSENRGDPEVFRILMANGVSSDGVGISKADALKVTSISNWFIDNTIIKDFRELVYFTNLKNLATDAFSGCSALEYVDLINIVTFSGRRHFRKCSKLRGDIALPNATTIPEGCFYATAIERIEAQSATSLGYQAFQDCKSLKVAVFGEGLLSIGYNVFDTCSSLESVVIMASTPPSVYSNSFNKTTCTIYVPDESVDAYKGASGWSSYASRIKGISEYNG